MSHFVMLTSYEKLVLAVLLRCYCSLRTFSDLALVFSVISLASFCLQICWTEDASLTRNRFPSKAICDQILLRQPCGVLMLNSRDSIAH